MSALRVQWSLFRASGGAWLDVRLRIATAEKLVMLARERKSRHFRHAPYRHAVERFFSSTDSLDVPEIAEVLLATLLAKEGICFETVSMATVLVNERVREQLLQECSCVFLSTTYLRDMSELDLVASQLKRPDNKVVAGGALAGLIDHRWQPSPWIDVLAIGYGEFLVPALAAWIRGNYQRLEPPPRGKLMHAGTNILIYSGLPIGKSLDDLQTPDWSLAQRYHRRRYPLALYESVRGCPYRCGFCNYPYLFGDQHFRMRSSEKIAGDWEKLAQSGMQYISCLDSLFTVPKSRLERLCNLLIARKVPVKWICFARAGDLTDLKTCELMKEAGCVKVAIGVESGSQKLLDNMDKRCSVDNNAVALRNCRAAGIVTSVSLIVGYPGETESTVGQTFEFLAANPPDIFHIYSLAIRSEGLPVLSESNRKKSGLETYNDGHMAQPYWRHATMSCSEASDLCRSLNERLMKHGVAMDGTLFYANSLEWDGRDRAALLDFQKDVITRQRAVCWMGEFADRWAKRRLENDMKRRMCL